MNKELLSFNEVLDEISETLSKSSLNFIKEIHYNVCRIFASDKDNDDNLILEIRMNLEDADEYFLAKIYNKVCQKTISHIEDSIFEVKN